MKILITGANGMVARAAKKHCESIGDEVVALTRQQLDISDRQVVDERFERERFDGVLNCAAYTDVDGAETNREVCYKTNADGVENLALACKKINARFVTISTDYIFDGANTGFYTQRDTPNPLGVYGASKLEGEIRARNVYARSIIVRSGWIYGCDGTNFLSVMHKLLGDGKKIKAIEDSYGTPTFAGDLAKRLRELAELDLPSVYHVTNSGVQVQLFEALGAVPPQFAHHSLLIGADGHALSKRLDSLSIEGFREAGLEPMAVLSHAALIGTSDAIDPHASFDSLVAGFALSKISTAPARFDLEELKGFNARLLHQLSYAAVADRLASMGIGGGEAFWNTARPNISVFADIAKWWTVVSAEITPVIEDAAFTAKAAQLLPPAPWTEATWSG